MKMAYQLGAAALALSLGFTSYAVPDQSDVDAAYDEWAGTTAALIGQMYDIVGKNTKHARLIEVVSEDYHVFLGQEIWHWIVEAMVIAAGIGGLAVWIKRRKRRSKEQENG